MSLFHRTKPSSRTASAQFPSDRYEPVLRSSICTGEVTACMRDRSSGKLTEIMLIRNSDDLEQFGKQYGVDSENLRTVY